MNLFGAGDLLLKDRSELVRVIASGRDFIQVLEYASNFNFTELHPKLYSSIDTHWYRWNKNGGVKILLHKICKIDPCSVLEQIADLSQLKADSFIIKGQAFKSINIITEEEGEKVIYLKGKSDAIIRIRPTKQETLHDSNTYVTFEINGRSTVLTPKDIWVVKRTNEEIFD